jgi:hypothetical protein
MKLIKLLLKEYSSKIIDTVSAKWKKENNVAPQEALPVIQRFEQIKDSIPKRLEKGTINLSKKFTHYGEYPITLEKLTQLHKIIKDYENNPTSDKRGIYDEASVQEDEINRANDKIRGKVPLPSDPRDILQYSWNDMEILLDSYQKEINTKGDFFTTQQADLVKIVDVPQIYNASDLKIYEASTGPNCIKLNYAFKFKKGTDIVSYNFCIGRKEHAANRYTSYRFGLGGKGATFRSFYFCIDATQSADINAPSEKEAKQAVQSDRTDFVNWYHFFIIHTYDDGTFGVTDAVNAHGYEHEFGSSSGKSWEEIGKFMTTQGGESGKKAWDKIKDKKKLFQYIAPNEEELEQAIILDKVFNLESFQALPFASKKAYIQNRAGEPNSFTLQMFESCPTELKALALNSGYTPSFDQIKDKNALIKTYVAYRFKRSLTDYETQIKNGKSPYDTIVNTILPLPFVKFLKEEDIRKYLKLFEYQSLSFELIEKYFGPEATSNYVNEQVKEYNYLPSNAIKFIKNPDIKKLYVLLSKLFTNWQVDGDVNPSEEELEKQKKMSTISVTPLNILVDQWLELSSKEQKAAIDLLSKVNNKEKYRALIYAVPFVLLDKGTRYILVPKKIEYESDFPIWAILDENGNIVKDNIPGDDTYLMVNGVKYEILSGYTGVKRIFNVNELIIDGEPFQPSISEIKRLQQLAGIL